VCGQDAIINVPFEVEGKAYNTTAISMGNPHSVIFVDSLKELNGLDLEKIGPGFENHMAFPERVNTEFIFVESKDVLHMRVWERGTGETLACGTGASASAVAAYLNGYANENVLIHLKGGDLKFNYSEGGSVFMEGPASVVFSGEVEA